MKVLVPVEHFDGLQSEVSDYLGCAAEHAIFDTVNGDVWLRQRAKVASPSRYLTSLCDEGIGEVWCRRPRLGAAMLLTAQKVTIRKAVGDTISELCDLWTWEHLPGLSREMMCDGSRCGMPSIGADMPNSQASEPLSK